MDIQTSISVGHENLRAVCDFDNPHLTRRFSSSSTPKRHQPPGRVQLAREREVDVLVVVEASPAFVRRLDAEGLGRTHPYHVLTRGPAVEHVDTVRVPGSDHDAILVDLVW